MQIRYMDYACLGKPAFTTVQAVARAAESLNHWDVPGTSRTLAMFAEVERARSSVAALLQVSAQEIALIENTTQGLGLLASSLRLKKTDNILIPDIEFMSSALVWRPSQQRIGFEIRPVKTTNGTVAVEDFQNAIDEHTKVIMTSSVQEVSGDRLDVAAVLELANANQTFLIIDGIQEAGVRTVNLRETPVHAYCAGGHKWLGNPFGFGFMYVHPTLLATCTPAYDGYLHVREPAGGWDGYLQSRERSPFDPLVRVEEAKRFESGGTPNWLGAIGLRHAVENLQTAGVEQIEQKVLQLNQRLRNSLHRIGLDDFLLGRQEKQHLSGIVTFGLPGGIEQERLLLHRLEEEHIHVSLRAVTGIGGIRVSPSHQNTADDVDRLAEVTEDFLKRG